MSRNLADPSYEPSDEELQQLARDAFADVPANIVEAQRRNMLEIESLRREALARLAAAKATR